jgi:hypothetical protein
MLLNCIFRSLNLSQILIILLVLLKYTPSSLNLYYYTILVHPRSPHCIACAYHTRAAHLVALRSSTHKRTGDVMMCGGSSGEGCAYLASYDLLRHFGAFVVLALLQVPAEPSPAWPFSNPFDSLLLELTLVSAHHSGHIQHHYRTPSSPVSTIEYELMLILIISSHLVHTH